MYAFAGPRHTVQGEVIYSKDGLRNVTVRSYPIDPGGTKRPFKAIEAQIGGIVDMDCAKIPIGDRGGTFFSSPSPGVALVGICDPLCRTLLCTEIVSEPIAYSSWKKRISDYMSYPVEDVLPIKDVWVCSSSGRWYITMPGWTNIGIGGTTFRAWPRTRGANKTGFVKTATLPGKNDKIMSMTEYVLDRPGARNSAMVVAEAAVNWDNGKWERMEARFMDDSGVGDLLKRMATQKNGSVPMRIGAGSIGIIESPETGTRAILLPIMPSEVQLLETSPMAIDMWVKQTMRDMWIEIVSDIQTLSGVTAYTPSSRLMNTLGIFSLGLAAGGVAGTWKAGMAGYGLGAVGALFTTIKDQAIAYGKSFLTSRAAIYVGGKLKAITGGPIATPPTSTALVVATRK